MGKAPKWGANTYKKRTKRKIGRHKKNMNKSQKRTFKHYVSRGDNFLPLKKKRQKEEGVNIM